MSLLLGSSFLNVVAASVRQGVVSAWTSYWGDQYQPCTAGERTDVKQIIKAQEVEESTQQ
jgi:hypothetical protein